MNNNADGPITLWYIDGSGNLISYGAIASGGTLVLPTFDNHNWVLRDEDGFFLDLIEGEASQAVDYGGNNGDEMYGGADANLMRGMFGSDKVYGGTVNDEMYGGTGADSLYGGGGSDTLLGDDGDDFLLGGTGNGTLVCGDGDDTLEGNVGNDTLFGEAGNDTLTGGTGDDIFVLNNDASADVVTNFSLADSDGFYDDQIDVSGLIGGTGPGGAVRRDDVTLSDVSGNALLTFPSGETLLLQGGSPSQMQSVARQRSAGIPCLAAGTMIRTRRGDVPVGVLDMGDLVCTIDNGPKPIVWVGHNTLTANDLRHARHLAPVHVSAAALGDHAALRVSPQHGILLRSPHRGGAEHLVRAKHSAQMKGRNVRIACGVASMCRCASGV